MKDKPEDNLGMLREMFHQSCKVAVPTYSAELAGLKAMVASLTDDLKVNKLGASNAARVSG